MGLSAGTVLFLFFTSPAVDPSSPSLVLFRDEGDLELFSCFSASSDFDFFEDSFISFPEDSSLTNTSSLVSLELLMLLADISPLAFEFLVFFWTWDLSDPDDACFFFITSPRREFVVLFAPREVLSEDRDFLPDDELRAFVVFEETIF